MSKDAYYFSHDSNARHDPKILAMIKDYGMEGYGRYWVIIEMLSEQSGYKLSHAKWVTNGLAMATQWDTNGIEKYLKNCIEDYELLESDGQHFWSNSLIARMKMKRQKQNKKIEDGRRGAEKRWGAIRYPMGTQWVPNGKNSKVKESIKRTYKFKIELV